MAFETSFSPSGRKLLNVGMAIVLGAAVTGFFAGTRASPSPPMAAPPAPRDTGSADASAGYTYRQLRLRQQGPNSEVTSSLDRFREAGPKFGDPVMVTPAQRDETLAARAERRAYDGAPPVVPHPIDEQSAHACVACHQGGMRIEGRRVPVMSHEFLDNCTACHVTAAPRAFGEAPQLDNGFAGAPSPGPGASAFEGAPPTIPHPLHMRDNCAACHGLGGPAGLRTTHPELLNCRQCHAPSSTELPWQR